MSALDDMLNQHAMGVQMRRVAGQYQQVIDRQAAQNEQLEKEIAKWQALCAAAQSQLSRHEPKNPVLVDKDLRQRIATAGARAFELAGNAGDSANRYAAARAAGTSHVIPGELARPAVELEKDLGDTRMAALEMAGKLHRISWACQLVPEIQPLLDYGLARVNQLHFGGDGFCDVSLLDCRIGITYSWTGIKSPYRLDGYLSLHDSFIGQVAKSNGKTGYLYASVPDYIRQSYRPKVAPQKS